MNRIRIHVFTATWSLIMDHRWSLPIKSNVSSDGLPRGHDHCPKWDMIIEGWKRVDHSQMWAAWEVLTLPGHYHCIPYWMRYDLWWRYRDITTAPTSGSEMITPKYWHLAAWRVMFSHDMITLFEDQTWWSLVIRDSDGLKVTSCDDFKSEFWLIYYIN